MASLIYSMPSRISQGAQEVLSKNPRPGLRDSEESDSVKPDRKIGASQVWRRV